jgi:hypothetical protein
VCGPAPVSHLWSYGQLLAAGLIGIRVIFGLCPIDLQLLISRILNYRCRLPNLGLNYRYQLSP